MSKWLWVYRMKLHGLDHVLFSQSALNAEAFEIEDVNRIVPMLKAVFTIDQMRAIPAETSDIVPENMRKIINA